MYGVKSTQLMWPCTLSEGRDVPAAKMFGPEDAAALGIDTDHLGYMLIGEMETTTTKVHRDASTLAVCEL